jgi:hypothetical protein
MSIDLLFKSKIKRKKNQCTVKIVVMNERLLKKWTIGIVRYFTGE